MKTMLRNRKRVIKRGGTVRSVVIRIEQRIRFGVSRAHDDNFARKINEFATIKNGGRNGTAKHDCRVAAR